MVRYSYLWLDEHAAGRIEGAKDRPCAIVLSVDTTRGYRRVTVAPITHHAPARPEDAVEIPAETKRRLGMDEARSWVVVTETNTFAWPGPDLRPIPGRPDQWSYGSVTGKLFQRIRDGLLSAARQERLGSVPREE